VRGDVHGSASLASALARVGDLTSDISEHLRSRQETGEALRWPRAMGMVRR